MNDSIFASLFRIGGVQTYINMKKLILPIALLATALGAQAQSQHWCSTMTEHDRLMEDPANRSKFEAFIEQVNRATNDPNASFAREGEKLIIPVVFHVLHRGGNENISKAQCVDQVRILNEDYNRLQDDTVNTPHRFRATEEAWFTFTSDNPADYAGQQRSISLYTPSGDQFVFWFNDGVSTTPPSGPGTKIAVNIASATGKVDVAAAFNTAVNQRAEFVTQSDTDNGNPRVKCVGEFAGDATDFASNNLQTTVVDSVHRQGSILAKGANIEFRLAHKDPLGNCTDGIVRVFTNKSRNASNASGFKGVSYWNAYSYLNIWVISDINSENNQFGTILGYAQFPASGLLSTDGIAIRDDNIGSIGTAAGNGRVGRTAVHEVGHWLNLIHIWGDATCGSDQVNDTPIAEGPNFGICGNASGTGTANFWTPYNLGVCEPESPNGEMFCNYMDYSDDRCMNMYTAGQVDRMRFTLTDGVRQYMVSAENLALTGTADPYTDTLCAPISDFYYTQGTTYGTTKMICAGEAVSFKESVFNGEVDTYAWTFEGGDPATSSAADPNNITYDNPGRFDVTLAATNAGGTGTTTKTDYVVVSPAAAQYSSGWGYVESFWNPEQFDADYLVFNHDGTENKWEFFSAPNAGSTGWESLRMNNFDNTVDEIDEIVSPSYDLSGIASPRLSFKYSGAALNSTADDEFRVFLSKDCGASWGVLSSATLTGFELTNTGLVSSAYVPGEFSEWSTMDAAIPSTYATSSNVRFKLQFTSGSESNNFYIDDISIASGIVGMGQVAERIGLSIAPNPAANTTRISLNLSEETKLNIQLVDVTGRVARDVYAGGMGAGSFNFDVDLRGMESGIYFVRVGVNNETVTRKLIVTE